MPQRKPARNLPSSPRKAANSASQSTGRAGHSRDHYGGRNLSNGLAYAVLIIFTLIAYANAWPDNLTFDDRVFADSGRFSGLGPSDWLRFFTEDLWAASGAESSLYRPLFLLLIASLSLVFGDWMAGYHLFNIGLHVMATVLVYSFIRQLLRKCGHARGEARQFALLAALLFGVHPIHTEVVNSIFNGSEILVTIGVIGGLKWFFDRQDRQPLKAWAGLNLAFLLVLLCRESGAALPLLVVALTWLTRSDRWLQRLRACAPVLTMLLPLGFYLVLRSHALTGEAVGAMAGLETPPADTSAEPLARVGLDFDLAKLAPAIVLWFDALKIQLWPHPLQIYYDHPQTKVWLALLAQLLLLAVAVIAYLRKHPLFLIGLGFFYLAILPSSRIISEPGVIALLSDRFIYLPSVGFVIMFAAALRLLTKKTSPNTAVVATLVITLMLIPVTWARNADWADDIRLFEADYRKLKDKKPILNTLLAAHLREKNFSRAEQICDENRLLIRDGHSMGVHCGSVYGQVRRFRDAEQAYLAVRSESVRVFADFNLGLMYLNLDRRAEAEKHIALAIAAEPEPFLRNYFQAVALIQMHPWDRKRLLEAQSLLEQALQLQPQHTESRQELEALNQKLR